MVVALRPAQQMEGDEARNLAQMGVARGPDLLERRFCAAHNLEAIHGDEHGAPLNCVHLSRPSRERYTIATLTDVTMNAL